MKTTDRYRQVVERFSREMPAPSTELHYNSPYELLVAVILSAQCTDKRVNMITPAFFERFPDAASLAHGSADEVFGLIRSCSYPNNKTRSLLGMARRLTEHYGGQVPDDLNELITLPGVGRKTANVILSVIYDRPAMAVDTHVFRVAERIGLTTRSKTPLQTEQTLTANIPQELIPVAHHWLILHGRYVCKARKPECEACFLKDLCRAYPRYRREAERREAVAGTLRKSTKTKPARD
ncbi:MAG: endonuclease III [Bacteroidales bacterium]|nr:endonuclease III [Bacteroidales bacterium]